uniref:Tyrosine-protein kinase ephrin type A/B receptor-like domain-containing protein n=1 Tax=Magallana gigas TaxID=29159 RepID=K1PF34_MAGGI
MDWFRLIAFSRNTARTPVMTTTFTIVYVTEDQPAGNCLYSFNVRMWESVSSFRNAFRLTCGELETGSISIENLELSPLAFQVNEVFHVKFSGEDSVCVSTFLSQKTQNIDLTCTSENQMCMSTCFGGYIQDDGGLSTVYNCSGEGWFPPLKSCISYTIPCGLDQLSSAIPNSKYTCAAHNQTCTVECSSGYVTSEGEVSVECRCEGDVLTPNRKLCLEYDIPFTTSALYTTYSTVDQVALSCLQDFREITERNKDLFQKTITDYCGDLVPCAPGMYMVSSQCVPCPEGHYQPLPGQLTCEPCTENRTVVGSGTNCTEIVDDENDFNLRKSQVGPTGLTETEIIVIAAVSVCVFFFLAVIATVYYCKKSKAKRRTSHADVPGDAKSGDGVSVKSDEYLRGSHEELIPGKSGSTNDPKWTYRDEQLIEKSTFASANEAKALDVLNTIIDINIDNEECITAQPPVCENVREGKWRPLHVRHKNESNVAVVINKAKETEPDKAPCRTLSDYDNFQIYVPEPEPSDPD